MRKCPTEESSDVGSMFGKVCFIIYAGIVTPSWCCVFLKEQTGILQGGLEWTSVEAHVRTTWRNAQCQRRWCGCRNQATVSNMSHELKFNDVGATGCIFQIWPRQYLWSQYLNLGGLMVHLHPNKHNRGCAMTLKAGSLKVGVVSMLQNRRPHT